MQGLVRFRLFLLLLESRDQAVPISKACRVWEVEIEQ